MSPHAPFTDLVAEVVQIIGQNSVAAFGVVFVELAQRPDEVFSSTSRADLRLSATDSRPAH